MCIAPPSEGWISFVGDHFAVHGLSNSSNTVGEISGAHSLARQVGLGEFAKLSKHLRNHISINSYSPK